jgi:hypothetical protein
LAQLLILTISPIEQAFVLLREPLPVTPSTMREFATLPSYEPALLLVTPKLVSWNAPSLVASNWKCGWLKNLST